VCSRKYILIIAALGQPLQDSLCKMSAGNEASTMSKAVDSLVSTSSENKQNEANNMTTAAAAATTTAELKRSASSSNNDGDTGI
jgi:hypothetical protein